MDSMNVLKKAISFLNEINVGIQAKGFNFLHTSEQISKTSL